MRTASGSNTHIRQQQSGNLYYADSNAPLSPAGSNTTLRQQQQSGNLYYGDSNGPVSPAEAIGLNWSMPSATHWIANYFSIPPMYGKYKYRAEWQEQANKARLERMAKLRGPQLRTLIKKLSFLLSFEKAGMQVTEACQYSHITRKTFYLWRVKDATFKQLLDTKGRDTSG